MAHRHLAVEVPAMTAPPFWSRVAVSVVIGFLVGVIGANIYLIASVAK